MQRAAMLAQSPLAKPQDLIVLDTGGSAAGASAAVQVAIKRGARIIMGPLFAEESRAAAMAAAGAAGGIPLLSFSNDEDLIGSGAFLLGITAGQSVTSVLRYARGRGIKRVAVLGGPSRWAAQGNAAAERLHGAAGLDVRILPVDTGIDQLLPALRRAGGGDLPDALLVTEGGDALRDAARMMSGSGLQLLGTQQAIELAPHELGGAWISGPDPAGLSDFAGRYGGGTAGPGQLAALAYDAMGIVEALRAGGAVDRAALVSVPSFRTTTGALRFAADGRAARELAILVAGPDGFTVVDKSGSL